MDKPITMSDKEYLILKVSQEYQIPLPTVRTIIENQFRTAKQAFKDNKSIEIAGFGRFYFNDRKAQNTAKKYVMTRARYERELLDPTLTELKRKNLLARVESLDKVELALKKKLDD